MNNENWVYIYEMNTIVSSPERLAIYFETSLKSVYDALDGKNHGECRGFHICWDRSRMPRLYKPVHIIEKNITFPSVRHMAYFYHTKEDDIRHAIKTNSEWSGWHVAYSDAIPEPDFIE